MTPDFDRHRRTPPDHHRAAEPPRSWTVRDYQAVEAGGMVDFHNGAGALLFSVAPSDAATQAQREALVDVYRFGLGHGEIVGRHRAQAEIRRALGVSQEGSR